MATCPHCGSPPRLEHDFFCSGGRALRLSYRTGIVLPRGRFVVIEWTAGSWFACRTNESDGSLFPVAGPFLTADADALLAWLNEVR